MSLDLIVTNYRTPNDLRHFLMSVERNSPTVPWTLTVVNVDPRGEDDATVQRFRTRLALREISIPENVGYARAVNRAVATTTSDVIAAFNADTRLLKDVADDCFNALQSNPKWAVLGPRQIDDKGRITHGGIFGTLSHRMERGFHHRNNDEFADIRDDAISVSGSAYFIKRSVWNELTDCSIYQAAHPEAEGAFLPTQHYWEETWASYHAIAHGHRVVYYGPATMVHAWHQASPVGGVMDRQQKVARNMFRDMCDLHGISHG